MDHQRNPFQADNCADHQRDQSGNSADHQLGPQNAENPKHHRHRLRRLDLPSRRLLLRRLDLLRRRLLLRNLDLLRRRLLLRRLH